MNRLCIYMTYSSTNNLKAHVRLFLESMVQYADVYLVCNFTEKINPKEMPGGIKKVFYRENKGWDAGAYKDTLCDYLGWKKVQQYKALILVNDSCYGPLYSLQDTFDLFENTPCDYWGMTGQEAGYFENPRYDFPKHLHSYFMVFKSNVIKNRAFQEYWNNLEYPVVFRDALEKFEVEINNVLLAEGFKFDNYNDIYGITLEENEIPAYLYSLELIRDFCMPVIKRKAMLIRNKGFQNAYEAVEFISHNCQYPNEYLWEVIDRQFDTPCGSLDEFVNTNDEIYIYGHGVCGKNLDYYLSQKGIKIYGFVVTELGQDDGEVVITYTDFNPSPNAKIIISVLNEGIAYQIKKKVLQKIDAQNIFMIADCQAIKLPK